MLGVVLAICFVITRAFLFREYSVNRTFGLTSITVDTFIRINIKGVPILIKAIHRTNLDTNLRIYS